MPDTPAARVRQWVRQERIRRLLYMPVKWRNGFGIVTAVHPETKSVTVNNQRVRLELIRPFYGDHHV